MLRRYIGKMTGLSRAQVTRLINRYKQNGRVSERSYRRNRFASHYTPADIELLAPVDEAHEILSGPATRKLSSMLRAVSTYFRSPRKNARMSSTSSSGSSAAAKWPPRGIWVQRWTL